jgi:hypothetical protein
MTITREDSAWRTTHIWTPGTVPYSQSGAHQPDGYRPDCSGYTSMCWAAPAPAGGSTVTLVDDGSIYQIAESDLKRGDAVGDCGPGTGGDYGHIQWFDGWDGDGYWVWEQTGGGWGPHHNYYRGTPASNGYQAYRSTNIIEGTETGMGERDAQLAASWSTTGSDKSGWAGGFDEADDVARHANRQMEGRLNTMIQRATELSASWTTTGSDAAGYVSGFVEADSVKAYSNREIETRLTDKLADLSARINRVDNRLHDLVRLLAVRNGHHDQDGHDHTEPWRRPGSDHTT